MSADQVVEGIQLRKSYHFSFVCLLMLLSCLLSACAVPILLDPRDPFIQCYEGRIFYDPHNRLRIPENDIYSVKHAYRFTHYGWTYGLWGVTAYPPLYQPASAAPPSDIIYTQLAPFYYPG